MRAVLYEEFQRRPSLATVADPVAPRDGVVLRVGATGICRSDWHGYMGHDPDIRLPHVPGHELAGTVVGLGAEVRTFEMGDRVTLPFVCGCGVCPECLGGNEQVCDHQFQPGFTHWGSFAEFVAIGRAEVNLVHLPDEVDEVSAASLGCRFATSFRALVHQGEARPGEWVAVHGCGGVGLSAIAIANALGAQVVGIDIDDEKLKKAQELGADATVHAGRTSDVPGAVKDLTHGGAHVSIDALGHPKTCANSVLSLRKRGRHVQVGLLLAEEKSPPIPMDAVIAKELRILGSHGMPAHDYPEMLRMIVSGKLEPARLVGRRVTLADSIEVLVGMDTFPGVGITVIDRF